MTTASDSDRQLTFDVVIVGGGHAGAHVAVELVSHGFDGTIAIVNAEDIPPYERPPLSKAYLKGEATQDSLLIRDAEYWVESGVSLLLGQKVVRIDPATKSVGTDGGLSITYSTLVWAAGGSARRLGIEGEDLAGVHNLRTLEDAHDIKGSLASAEHYVIVGGGFVGLEAAAVLSTAGIRVTVLEAQDRLLARVTGTAVSEYFLRRHTEAGVDVHRNSQVTRIDGHNGQVTGVTLATGEQISADHVLVAVGLVTSVAPLLDAGAAGIGAVDVDGFGRTSITDIFAAGDCVTFPYDRHPAGRVRLESIQNAVEQAKGVAQSIIGNAVAYDPQPWFWSNQYDIKFKTVGLALGYDATVVRGDPSSGSFSVVYLDGSIIVAVDTLNHMRDYVGARTAVGRHVDVDKLADDAHKLKDILVEDPATTVPVP
ncbi:NAD(P)/FAD-dependent oxidoreductase [Rhodococcoides yunnanense]|uniref:NAD(P)/FAD-dependent oxidoreductase n=1 Tax=Rhodococcoides yunnanense TaxID=278209 RepID=UPI0009344A68|nr:FAD-dependent oxidoreductase [Rhodococcus yunnanensis]